MTYENALLTEVNSNMAVQEALRAIDDLLVQATVRNLFSASEVADALLDVRYKLTPSEVLAVETSDQ